MAKNGPAGSRKPSAPATVVFLGAGASRCSGYPVAKDLLPEIEKEAESAVFQSFRSFWEPWKRFREEVTTKLKDNDPLARLITNPNPEIALSAIDLMEAALEAVRRSSLWVIACRMPTPLYARSFSPSGSEQ